MENEKTKKLLPIGTIVLLKNANTELMITSYCMAAMPQNYEDGNNMKFSRDMLYDYGGCRYPEGIMTTNAMIVFNEDQIDKVIHMGYKTEESDKHIQELKDKMADFIDKAFNSESENNA
jgi:hypothetical protein